MRTCRTIMHDIRPAREGEAHVNLDAATVNDLGGRTMSQETRDIFLRFRDFLTAAAKELADREHAEVEAQITLHGALGRGRPSSRRRASPSCENALKQLEKNRGRESADVLQSHELPALAAMLGPKSEADVDAAAVELMRLAGLTLAGKVWLRDGRTGERFANPGDRG